MYLEERLLDNFTEYANYVNNERAITHYYDGLKPVMRRILYTMYRMKLKPEGQTKKNATIVGKVMEFHPHGDIGIYNTLARSAQDFSVLNPPVEWMGNMGSIEMPPAAARYTESKFSDFGWTLVEGLAAKTVPMVPNYDGTQEEPVFLPAPFPYLLVNGSIGIGVGMAASIPSHNLTDVLNMMIHYINNPTASTSDLVDKLQGPDFGSGCSVVNQANFKEIYSKGSGSFKMRAKFKTQATQITITNLPYRVPASKIIEQLQSAQDRGELGFIKNIIDTTSQTEQLIVEITGKDYDTAIREICRVSDAEKSFSLDFSVVLETPRRVNLLDYVEAWTKTHKEIITKDLQNQLDKVASRVLIVGGLLQAVAEMDKIIALIRDSENRAEAKTRLQNMGFFAIQADAILDLKLSRLTKLDAIELRKEMDELKEESKRLNTLLTNEDVFIGYLTKEFESYKHLATKRQSEINDSVFPKKEKDENITFSVAVRGTNAVITEGISGLHHGNSKHPVYILSGADVIPIKNLKEALIPNVWFAVDNKLKSVFHFSEDGFVKRTHLSELQTSRKAIVAKQEKVISVLGHDDTDRDIYALLTLSDGKQVQFKIDDITATGRNTRGVTAVKLSDDQKVVSAIWTEKVPGVQVGRNRKLK